MQHRYIKNIIAIAFFTLILIGFVMAAMVSEREDDYLTNVRFASLDDEIRITWDLPFFNNAQAILVSVSSDDCEYVETLSPHKREYIINSGTHGTLYNLAICEIYTDGTAGEVYPKQLLYLDYDQLPELPTVYLTTTDGEDPTYYVVAKPDEALMGESIDHNEDVSGSMLLEWPEHQTRSSLADIRIRGNTSSAYGGKQSYKLHLQQSLDLLNMGSDYAAQDWILLRSGKSMKTYIGEFLAERSGMDWVTHGMLVNVMLNNDWKGTYYLSEAVDIDSNKGGVTESGYIFENDAYWWKPDTIYFKLPNQIYEMGFTFKYPNIDSDDDSRLMALQDYMEVVETLILSGDESVSEYIDYDSFVEWILVRDIMHTGDAGGLNLYYYLQDFDSDDYKANLLRMGPLWDFDAGMNVSDDNTGWSAQHNTEFTYFPYLFTIPSFRNAYKERWQQVSSNLAIDFVTEMEQFYDEYGSAIDESRRLESARWDDKLTSLRTEIDQDELLMRDRIAWMNEQIQLW